MKNGSIYQEDIEIINMYAPMSELLNIWSKFYRIEDR